MRGSECGSAAVRLSLAQQNCGMRLKRHAEVDLPDSGRSIMILPYYKNIGNLGVVLTEVLCLPGEREIQGFKYPE